MAFQDLRIQLKFWAYFSHSRHICNITNNSQKYFWRGEKSCTTKGRVTKLYHGFWMFQDKLLAALWGNSKWKLKNELSLAEWKLGKYWLLQQDSCKDKWRKMLEFMQKSYKRICWAIAGSKNRGFHSYSRVHIAWHWALGQFSKMHATIPQKHK